MWRKLSLAMAAVFLLFAFVQVNDPDPLAWVFVYGITALYSVYSGFRRISPGPVAAWAFGCVAMAMIVAGRWDGTSNIMGAGGWFGEEIVRESLGLGFAGLWSVVIAIVAFRQSKLEAEKE